VKISKKHSEMLKICSMLKKERSANERMLLDLKKVKEAFKTFVVSSAGLN
jgi:plasmid rolling circle replication initiator protein Rep